MPACTPAPAPVRDKGPVFERADAVRATTRIEILRYDRERGASWTAAFSRDADGRWQVERAPEGAPLLDRQADSAFFVKLLDLLSSLKIQKVAGNAPLAELGLDPPLIALRMTLADGKGEPVELRLGTTEEAARYAYASLSSDAPSPKQGPPVWEVQGAALHFLGFMDSFSFLRDRRLVSPWIADDVDILRMKRNQSPLLDGEREGVRWKNNARQPVADRTSTVIAEKLDALTHLRAQAFIDDAAEVARLEKLSAGTKERLSAELLDRDDRALTIEVLRDGNRLYAKTTHRPGAWFELHPDAARFWNAGSPYSPAALSGARGTKAGPR